METETERGRERKMETEMGKKLLNLEQQLEGLQIILAAKDLMNSKEGKVTRTRAAGKVRSLMAVRKKIMFEMAKEKTEVERKICLDHEGGGKDEEKIILVSEDSAAQKKRKARKRNRKAKGKGKAICDAEKIEAVSENYEERKKGEDAEERDADEEKFKDPLAFDYKTYKQFWNEIYAKFHGRFEDNSV